MIQLSMQTLQELIQGEDHIAENLLNSIGQIELDYMCANPKMYYTGYSYLVEWPLGRHNRMVIEKGTLNVHKNLSCPTCGK